MRTVHGFVLVLWAVAGPLAVAEQPRGKILRSTWDVAYLEGAKAGYAHTTVREVERDDRLLYQTSTELSLTVKRYKQLVRMRMDTGTEETSEGKVTGVSMTHYLDRDKKLILTGTVEGNRLHVTAADGRFDKRIPWNDRVIGLDRQEKIFQVRKVKPGDEFGYQAYVPEFTMVVAFQVTVMDIEEIEVLGQKQRLLRAEVVPQKIAGADIQLPTMNVWLDKDLLPVRTQTEFGGLGKMVFYRTTEEVATRQNNAVAAIRDLGYSTLIRLNRAMDRPHDTKAVVYRITIDGDEKPTTAFARDERQKLLKTKGQTIDLRVEASRGPEPLKEPGQANKDYLKSCYFLNSDDPKVRELTHAVGREADPWKRAQLIEKWVHEHMEKSNTITFATADQVARNLEGDCRQHAMLATAMCRAAGVPARTAIGLVYVNDPQRGPVMGFHMWTEVWIDGQWLALDSTLGRGHVGAGHLKIADHSWVDVQSLTPVLPVMRVLGKLSIEVLRVEGNDS